MPLNVILILHPIEQRCQKDHMGSPMGIILLLQEIPILIDAGVAEPFLKFEQLHPFLAVDSLCLEIVFSEFIFVQSYDGGVLALLC